MKRLTLILCACVALTSANAIADLKLFSGTKIVFGDGTVMRSAPGTGGTNNSADGLYATVAGGAFNSALGDYSAIGGGTDNVTANDVVEDNYQTIAGGWNNLAQGTAPSIGGGEENATLGSGFDNVIAGGYFNTAGDGTDNTGYGTVGGGGYNTASGDYSTVPGGFDNFAYGHFSYAAGRSAEANHTGAFVWSDSTTQAILKSLKANEFVARASGGFYFYSNAATTVGVRLPPGASTWSVLSDRNVKENILPVSRQNVLEKIVAMPVQTFTYKDGDPDVSYMGVMAQDFYDAFQLGADDRHVTEYDMAGAALAAIQGLNEKLLMELKLRDKQIDALQLQLDQLVASRSMTETENSH